MRVCAILPYNIKRLKSDIDKIMKRFLISRESNFTQFLKHDQLNMMA